MVFAEYDSSGNTGFSYLNDDLKNTTVAKGLQGLTPLIGMKVSDEDESTTKSAIAEAKIDIMNPDKQKQSIIKLDRNTTKTLNALGKIFDKKKIEEKQEMAAVFQDIWHTTVGDLVAGRNISKDQQRALNILGGAIAADLAGGSVGGALVGGATVELLQDSFSKITSPALRKVAVAIGAAIAAKGTGQEATAAANVAVAIQTFNEDNHNVAEAYVEANYPDLKGQAKEDKIDAVENMIEEIQMPSQQVVNTVGEVGSAIGSGMEVAVGFSEFIKGLLLVDKGKMIGGAGVLVNGSSQVLGSISTISNMLTGSNNDWNFIKTRMIELDPQNGEKYYNFGQAMLNLNAIGSTGAKWLSNVGAINQVENISKYDKIAAFINAIDLNKTIKEMEKEGQKK